jgi:nucleotide-binding universal stress UspA family protein
MTNDSGPHVTVCTDDPGRTPRVMEHASALTAAAGGRLSVLHIVDGERASEQQAKAALAGTHVDRDVSAFVASRQGDERIADAIARQAAECRADMIAVDSRDLTMFRHVIRGSTAMEVLSATMTPLMVASTAIERPRDANEFHFAVLADGSEASLAVLTGLEPLFGRPNMRFTLLQIYVPRLGDRGELVEMASCEQQLMALLPRFPESTRVSCHIGLVDGLESVAHAILRVAGELGVDSIAMATQGQTAVRHVLLGSVALAVTQHSSLPVILARATKGQRPA